MGGNRAASGDASKRPSDRIDQRIPHVCRNLESRGNDTTTLVDIENALLNPLLNTQVRVELRRRYGEILQAYADRPIPDFASFAATAIVSGETATQFQERLQQLALAAVKDLNDPIVQPLLESSFAGTWNGLVVPAQHEPLQQRLNNPSESASLAADCERLQPVDSALRRAAHCLAELPNTAGPAWQAQARAVSVDLFQQQSALQTCFEASRSVEDCWGNNESIAVGTTPTSDPYFVAATRQQLGRLEKSAAKGTREVQQVREQLERYLTAVTNISVSANKLVFQPEVSDTPQTIGVHLPEQLPAGFAAAAIRHMGEQPVTVEVKLENSATARKFAVPTAAGAPGQGPDSSLECFVPVQTYLSGRSRGDFEALVAFRGHVRTQNFRAERARSNVIAAPEEVLIALEPQPLGLPNIEVRKEGKNITDVIVVVDCSASMNDKLQIQGEIGGIEENRLDHLKAAIEEVFATMAESGSFRVALVAFGHRRQTRQSTRGCPAFQRCVSRSGKR